MDFEMFFNPGLTDPFLADSSLSSVWKSRLWSIGQNLGTLTVGLAALFLGYMMGWNPLVLTLISTLCGIDLFMILLKLLDIKV